MRKKKRESSYQKLNRRYNDLWKVYVEARRRMRKAGMGMSDNDYILGREEMLEDFT